MSDKWIAPTKEAANNGFARWDIVCKSGDDIQTIATVRNVGSAEERQRIANRIAALPELEADYKEAIELLEIFVEDLDDLSKRGPNLCTKARQRAKAALAKAEEGK